MREMRAKNREHAVQAITRKNHLQQLLDDTQKIIDDLQAKADLAVKRGDDALAERILKEKQDFETILRTTLDSFRQAIETSNAIKDAIKREDERIREKIREALRLKEQWRASPMPLLPTRVFRNKIPKSLTWRRAVC